MNTDQTWRFPADVAPSTVASSLQQNGIAVLDDFLQGDDLAGLSSETATLFEQRDDGDLKFGASAVKRLYAENFPQVMPSRPVLRKLSESRLVRSTADDFFGAGRWDLGAIFAMSYRDKMPRNELFHIDPSATVKFFYYLSDVAPENGPFTFCMGSHREGYFRMRCGALEGNPGSKVIPNNEVRNVTPILGKAGTLIIFNSIAIHKAGDIQAGNGRRTVTFHYGAKYEASLRKRLYRKIRGTAGLEFLCAYAPKHQSLMYDYKD